MEEDLLYDIKTLPKEDVVTIFRTVIISPETTGYIYTALSNPYVDSFIDDIINLYISKKVYLVFYDLLDAWEDHLKHNNKNFPLKEKLKNILVDLLRTDQLEIENRYIDLIKNDFDINYYAEIMMG